MVKTKHLMFTLFVNQRKKYANRNVGNIGSSNGTYSVSGVSGLRLTFGVTRGTWNPI